MYRCTECGHLFDEPKHYFVDRNCDHPEEMYSCPYCNDGDTAYDEVKLCPLCEENYVAIDSHGHVDFCDKCKENIRKKYAKLITDNFREDDYDYIYDFSDGKSYEDLRKEI